MTYLLSDQGCEHRLEGLNAHRIITKAKCPQVADCKGLPRAGLSLINVSLDTLRADRFERMTRRRGHERVLETIQQAVDLGYDPVKVSSRGHSFNAACLCRRLYPKLLPASLSPCGKAETLPTHEVQQWVAPDVDTVRPLQVNVVVMRGQNDDEIGDFVELTRRQPLNVRFIEYMPFDGNVWTDTKMVSFQEMLAAVHRRFPQGLERLQVTQSCYLRKSRLSLTCVTGLATGLRCHSFSAFFTYRYPRSIMNQCAITLVHLAF